MYDDNGQTYLWSLKISQNVDNSTLKFSLQHRDFCGYEQKEIILLLEYKHIKKKQQIPN